MYYIECRIQNKINRLTDDIYQTKEDEYQEIKDATQKSLEYFKIILETSKITFPEFEESIKNGISKAHNLRRDIL